MRDKLLQQYGFDQKDKDGKGQIREEIQEETESQNSSESLGDDMHPNIN